MVLNGKLPIYFTSPNEEPRVHHEMTDEEIHYVNHLRLSKNDRQKQLVARIGEKVVDYNNLKVDSNPRDSCHFAFRHSNPPCDKSLTQQKLAHFPNNGHTFVFQYFVNTGLLRSPVNNMECADSICDFESQWPVLKGQTSDLNIRVLVYDLVSKAPRDDEGEQCDAACAAEMYETPMVSDSIYYHGTHIRNVPSILYEGQLRPSSRSNVHLGDTPEGCHLTNEFEVAREFATRSRLHILDNIAVTSAREDYTEIVRRADEARLEFTQVVFKAHALTPPDIWWDVDSSTRTWMNPAHVRLQQMYVIIGSPMHKPEKVGDYRVNVVNSPDGHHSFQISKHKCHADHPDPRKMFTPMRPWVPMGYYHAPS